MLIINCILSSPSISNFINEPENKPKIFKILIKYMFNVYYKYEVKYHFKIFRLDKL